MITPGNGDRHRARPIALDENVSLVRAHRIKVGDVLIIGQQEWELEVAEIDRYMRGGKPWLNFHFDHPGIDLASPSESLVFVKHQTLL